MQALIVGAMLKDYNYLLKIYDKYNFKIAVDRGAEAFYKAKLMPDLMLGDFDSINQTILNEFESSGASLKKFKIDKDKSDLELAIEEAKYFNRIDFSGVLGGKLSHELFNINLLINLKREGYKVSIREPNTRVEFLKDGDLLKIPKGLRVSIVPSEDMESKVSLKGFKWNLNKAPVCKYSSLTLSNETIDCGFIKVYGEVLMVIIEPLEHKTRQEKKSL